MSDDTLQAAGADGVPATGLRWLDLVRVARPGLMASHLWFYLLPAVAGAVTLDRSFWIALVYVTVPLGLLIYGWNDFFDADVDALSRRKNRRVTANVYGPRLPRRQRAALPWAIAAAQLPFLLMWIATGQLALVGWLAAMALGNALYNGPGPRLSRVPIAAELTAASIYLLIVGLGVLVHSPGMPAWCWPFAALTVLNLQVLGTLVDREDDARVGKRTLSVAFGRSTALATVLAMQAARVAISWFATHDPIATAALALCLVLMALGFSMPRWRPSSTAYALSLALDWVWLVLVLGG